MGTTPVVRFKKASKGFHPADLLADAQSEIVIGKFFPLKLLMGKSKAAITKTMEVAFDSLDRCAFEASCFIETTGEQALPVPSGRIYLSWKSN